MIRRTYTPRPYAALAMDLFASTPRCALFAKPGMGKTPMVLTFLAFKYDVWGESAPTLVVGPKRVAEHVWPDEVKKWDHLTGLSVVCITGTAAQRAAAHASAIARLLGRVLLPGEVVHHKDGNKRNNQPSNLEVMTQAEHARLHMLERLARRA